MRKLWSRAKTEEPCPGMWRDVREPHATQHVLVCHSQDLCRRPCGQYTPGYAHTLHVLTTEQMARILTMRHHDTSSGLGWGSLTSDMPGYDSVFAVDTQLESVSELVHFTEKNWYFTSTELIQWRPCALRHDIQISTEAILSCHPAPSTEWLGLGGKMMWMIMFAHIPTTVSGSLVIYLFLPKLTSPFLPILLLSLRI